MSTVISFFSSTGKKFIPERFKRSVKLRCGVPDTEGSLAQLKRCGFSPAATVDVGAYSGEWTRSLLRFFPNTRVLMIEPQHVKSAELGTLCSCHSGLELATVLVGSEAAEGVAFYETDTASSVLKDANHDNAPYTVLTMTTLDNLVRERQFPSPAFIKVDVQGYELEVLRGAEQTLKSAEVILMEINLLPIYRDAPLAHDAVRFMADRGFNLYDIGTFFRRPYDNALWQMDAVFVRSSSHLIASSRWS
jgi:FkbM family methyltransferase